MIYRASNRPNRSSSIRQNNASKLDCLVKRNKLHVENKKNLKIQTSLGNSSNLPSTSSVDENRMELLERQVATLTTAVQACLGGAINNGANQSALMAQISSVVLPITPTNTKPGRGRPRKNGLESKITANNIVKKQLTSDKAKKKKHHLTSDEESDSNDDMINQAIVVEPINFNPEDFEDLKKLKNDLENLRGKSGVNFLYMS